MWWPGHSWIILELNKLIPPPNRGPSCLIYEINMRFDTAEDACRYAVVMTEVYRHTPVLLRPSISFTVLQFFSSFRLFSRLQPNGTGEDS